MVVQKIKYVNLDGKQCEENYSFNLSQQDFVRLSLRYQPSIEQAYENLVDSGNLEGAYDLLADLIESSYGVREGDAFIKNRRIQGRDSRPDLANFKFHPAFDQLMLDLMGEPDLLIHFFRNLTNVPMTEEDFNKFSKEIKAIEAEVQEVVEVEEEEEKEEKKTTKKKGEKK